MKRKICTFAGHNDVPQEIRPLLAKEIERHITELEITEFWVGNYGDFDRMAKAEVRKAKEKHPEIKLYLYVPYLPGEKVKLDSEGVDGIIFPEEMERVPKRFAIPRLNRYMSGQADSLIAYVSHVSGGAYKTLEYAKGRERKGQLTITNLA